MDTIEIKNIQNVAQNMIIGSKQHSLFKPVVNNNFPLLSTTSSAPEYKEAEPAGETGQKMVGFEIDIIKTSEAGNQPVSGETPEKQKDTGLVGGADSQLPTNTSGLNKHLYGPLKPCSKQFMSGK